MARKQYSRSPSIRRWSLHPGKLQVISLTGGLLYLSNLLGQGSRVKLIFLTNSGPVLGAAEMLSPISWTQQPFRFLTLDECDQRKLRAAI